MTCGLVSFGLPLPRVRLGHRRDPIWYCPNGPGQPSCRWSAFGIITKTSLLHYDTIGFFVKISNTYGIPHDQMAYLKISNVMFSVLKFINLRVPIDPIKRAHIVFCSFIVWPFRARAHGLGLGFDICPDICST